ncbi:MAG: nodulation protein NfeD [Thermoleophilia bacterium]|nr:nodulation protein NfeD [Thermoleophilia bacterium]
MGHKLTPGYGRRIVLPSTAAAARVAGALILLALLAVVSLVMAAPVSAQERQAPVWFTRVEGVVNPPLSAYLTKTMTRAADAGAQALVIGIDTPGGLDSSMREIIQAELETTIAVVIFVYPPGARSASAGVYIMMGADVTAMAPQTNLGSAHPVSLTGDMDEEMQKKVTNDAAAYIKGLALNHGRNAVWAEQAVRESVSLTAEEALDQNVVEFVAADLDDLLREMDGFTTKPKGLTLRTAGAPVVEVGMSWRERFIHTLADPNLIFILLLLGVYGLIFEFQNPGIGVPGIAGAISLLLAAYGLQLLPVSYVGLALIVVAMVLYVAEIKVQSQGVLGLGATVALVLGGLLLFDDPGSFIRVDWGIIGLAAALSLAFFAFVIQRVARAHRYRPHGGAEGLIGEVAVVRTRLAPNGQVLVHGEIWQARSEGEPVDRGDEVVVLGVEGLRLKVRRRTET